ncbi:helix-turn-helix domain-containing protein [Vibrio parahaemolyticus]
MLASTVSEDDLLQLLVEHGGNVSAAARAAKIDRSTFYRRLRKSKIGTVA